MNSIASARRTNSRAAGAIGAAMAKILLEEPDILLLDEPTNYLDLEGTAWLEGWIQKFPGAVVLVSHDRHFLDRVVTRIVEVENYHLHEYEGGFSDYVREKQFRFKTLESQFQHEEELLAGIGGHQRSPRGGEAPGRPYQAQARQHQEERCSSAGGRDCHGNLQPASPPRICCCAISELSKSFGERTLFADLSLSLMKRRAWLWSARMGAGNRRCYAS